MFRRIALSVLALMLLLPSALMAQKSRISSSHSSTRSAKSTRGHFVKIEDYFKGVLLSLHQVQVVGYKEIDSRSPRQQQQNQTESCSEKMSS
jgi:hypothetical protein